MWDTATGQLIHGFEGHGIHVSDCNFSPDGHFILSASWGHDIALWNAVSGELVRVIEGHHDNIQSCSFSPDGQLIISAGDDRAVIVRDTHTSQVVRTLHGHSKEIEVCRFSPDGRYIVSPGWIKPYVYGVPPQASNYISSNRRVTWWQLLFLQMKNIYSLPAMTKCCKFGASRP